MDELTKLNTRLEDSEYLITTAVESIILALKDGNANGKHDPGSWREETLENHLTHLIEHAEAVRSGKITQNDAQHMVCRAVMACIAYLEDYYKDL